MTDQIFDDPPLPEHDERFRPRWPGDEGGYSAAQMRRYRHDCVTADATDAQRWRALVQHAILGFDASPHLSSILRVPVFSHGDQTITEIVDRLRANGG